MGLNGPNCLMRRAGLSQNSLGKKYDMKDATVYLFPKPARVSFGGFIKTQNAE